MRPGSHWRDRPRVPFHVSFVPVSKNMFFSDLLTTLLNALIPLLLQFILGILLPTAA